MILDRVCSKTARYKECRTTWKCNGACKSDIRVRIQSYCRCKGCIDEHDKHDELIAGRLKDFTDCGSLSLTKKEIMKFCYPTEYQLIVLEMLE